MFRVGNEKTVLLTMACLLSIDNEKHARYPRTREKERRGAATSRDAGASRDEMRAASGRESNKQSEKFTLCGYYTAIL